MAVRIHRGNETITLADVARMAGVSAATVSRYLNEPTSIKAKHREPIQGAIEALNYVPNAAARALASRSSRMIGAVFPRIDSLLFAKVYETLQKELAEGGYTLVVTSCDYDAVMEYEQVRNFIANRVESILLVGTVHDPRTIPMVERSGTPLLLTACWNEDFKVPQIGFSNEVAAQTVSDHLIGLGHRDIAVMMGGQQTNDRAIARLEGIRSSMSRHGLTLANRDLLRCEFTFESGGAGLRHFMSRANPPTAIICGSDILASGALFEAQRLGLRVPEDISITGFDDTELARATHPPLTSLRTPRREVALNTAATVLALLQEGKAMKSVLLPTQLKVRGTTGPPRNANKNGS